MLNMTMNIEGRKAKVLFTFQVFLPSSFAFYLIFFPKILMVCLSVNYTTAHVAAHSPIKQHEKLHLSSFWIKQKLSFISHKRENEAKSPS